MITATLKGKARDVTFHLQSGDNLFIERGNPDNPNIYELTREWYLDIVNDRVTCKLIEFTFSGDDVDLLNKVPGFKPSMTVLVPKIVPSKRKDASEVFEKCPEPLPSTIQVKKRLRPDQPTPVKRSEVKEETK